MKMRVFNHARALFQDRDALLEFRNGLGVPLGALVAHGCEFHEAQDRVETFVRDAAARSEVLGRALDACAETLEVALACSRLVDHHLLQCGLRSRVK